MFVTSHLIQKFSKDFQPEGSTRTRLVHPTAEAAEIYAWLQSPTDSTWMVPGTEEA